MGSAYSWKLSIENNTQSVHDMIINMFMQVG
jgi:hypothetical protein